MKAASNIKRCLSDWMELFSWENSGDGICHVPDFFTIGSAALLMEVAHPLEDKKLGDM
jgi:hypothetical protein